MSSNYTGSPTLADSPSPAPNLSGNYPIATLPADGDALAAASVAQEARLGPNWLTYIVERYRDTLFGTGVDGTLTQSSGGNTDITSVAMYSTVSVTFGAIRTNGYPIIARNSITVGSTGTINGSGNGAGYNAGAVGPHGCTVPGPGVASSTASYVQSLTVYGLGGNSGRGGGPSSGGGTVVSPGSSYKTFPYRFHGGPPIGQNVFTPGSSTVYSGTTYDAIKGGAAGTNGDFYTGTTASGVGGAGGALVVLMAPIINFNGASLVSNGGNGQPGSGSAYFGGGGGGGGAFLFVCQQLNITGTAPYYSANAGTGGIGIGGAGGGFAGAAGNTTPYIVMVP